MPKALWVALPLLLAVLAGRGRAPSRRAVWVLSIDWVAFAADPREWPLHFIALGVPA
jgi:hypothetical protein